MLSADIFLFEFNIKFSFYSTVYGFESWFDLILSPNLRVWN